mgnify:CR=1 FL=1
MGLQAKLLAQRVAALEAELLALPRAGSFSDLMNVTSASESFQPLPRRGASALPAFEASAASGAPDAASFPVEQLARSLSTMSARRRGDSDGLPSDDDELLI